MRPEAMELESVINGALRMRSMGIMCQTFVSSASRPEKCNLLCLSARGSQEQRSWVTEVE